MTAPIPGSSSVTGSAVALSSRRPLVTLTSDFGTGSPYVAAMKAAVIRECGDADLIDISHEVPPFDWAAGAFMLWAGSRDFPANSIHLAVVDPGVGSDRPAVAFELAGRYYVGPDNGIFSLVAEAAAPTLAIVYNLERPDGASATFEGRDLFAPVAGRLAAGAGLAEIGEPRGGLEGPSATAEPRVLWVDRFGNLITNLRPPVGAIRVGEHLVHESARTYAEASPRKPFYYVGSMGFVEIAVPRGRADSLLQAVPGTAVEPL